MRYKKWESDDEFRDVYEMFAYINKRADEMNVLMDFLTDTEMLYYAKQHYLSYSDDLPTETERIENACHVILARLWLVSRGIVKTPSQVKENLFGLN